jgi:hypothetical protein
VVWIRLTVSPTQLCTGDGQTKDAKLSLARYPSLDCQPTIPYPRYFHRIQIDTRNVTNILNITSQKRIINPTMVPPCHRPMSQLPGHSRPLHAMRRQVSVLAWRSLPLVLARRRLPYISPLLHLLPRTLLTRRARSHLRCLLAPLDLLFDQQRKSLRDPICPWPRLPCVMGQSATICLTCHWTPYPLLPELAAIPDQLLLACPIHR